MLQALVEYAHKNLDSEPGFKTRAVHWLVDISADGRLINILPLGNDRGEATPKCPDMHKMNARGKAHFLVETLQTVTMLCKKDITSEELAKSRRKRTFFRKMIWLAAREEASFLEPLAKFMNNRSELRLLRNRFAKEKAKPADLLKWRITGTDPLTQATLLDWWRNWRIADQAKGETKTTTSKKTKKPSENVKTKDDGMVCFLSGNTLKPLSTHRPINGLPGGHTTGDVMAAFDKPAFRSFGLQQSCNAAMGEIPAQEYVDALNHLIRDKKHTYRLANTLIVHWFKEAIPQENDPLAMFFELPEVTEGNAQQSAREILGSLRSGQRPVPPNNRYFALTLSGASKRVMVRDWMERSFEELIDKIDQWFSDLEITDQYENRLAKSPRFNDVCISLVRNDREEKKSYMEILNRLPAPTAATLLRVALAGLPIPQPIIAQALGRFRADITTVVDGKPKPFSPARMGLIKAYFIRKGDQQMSAYLNKEHPEPAYQCGRLLAVLANLQKAAIPDVGAGVVQRYYVAASQTPGLTIGRLISNAKNHIGKVASDRPGLASWFEDQIAEIMSQIQDYIPKTLNLDQQSLFALGYYQQIASRKDKVSINDSDTTEKGENQ
jgi:CRISPR-associated protein Csd1